MRGIVSNLAKDRFTDDINKEELDAMLTLVVGFRRVDV